MLVAIFQHTSLNVMGDLGLSGLAVTARVFFLFIAIAAMVILLSSPAFRRSS